MVETGKKRSRKEGIVIIIVEATGRVAATLKPDSLGSIIGQFKSIITKNIRRMGLIYFKWQPNYYEHIIRNDSELNRIREYILYNPLKWEYDKDNPDGKPDDAEKNFWKNFS